MYLTYWKFRQKPFENTLDPHFFYFSPGHCEALSRMVYSVWEHKAGFFLMGPYGTGKTLLSRCLMKECPDDQFRFAMLTNPRLDPLELIQEIYYQLGGNVDSSQSFSKTELIRSITQKFEDNYKEGFHSVVIVDEAQSIENESLLEELRLLLNIQREDSILFTLLLLGQPDLLDKIDRIPQLKQRIAITYYIKPLTKPETKRYIQYRLHTAGSERDVFTEASYDEIYSLSEGVPRAINNICDLALLTGFIKRADTIDEDVIVHVGRDLEGLVQQG
ncbi:MAG: AAA family ATPase [Candidatus Omnitrophota bacterium]|nr:MAG: AAA family ATPase [Candidatus Omnitrophota bacterium]